MEKIELYDVALSFAGEDRPYVEEIAYCLKNRGLEVFYDKFAEIDTWGEDLYIYFSKLYSEGARYCVFFISKYYKEKNWTYHEIRNAFSKAFKTKSVYLLPVRLDDTKIEGLSDTVGYIDGREYSANDLCEKIFLKVNPSNTTKATYSKANYVKEDLSDIPLPNLRKKFNDREKKKFLENSFNEIKTFFIKAGKVTENKFDNINIEIDNISKEKFSCIIYVDGNIKGSCKVWISSGFSRIGDINYSESSTGVYPFSEGINDYATISESEDKLYFELSGMSFGLIEGINRECATANDIAKHFWSRLIKYIEY